MSYREQLQRLERNYQRFAEIDQGRPHDRGCLHYLDEVYSFFLNCYHLKDWLKKDPGFPGSTEVESYIDANQELQLCADICNAYKHHQLDKPPRSAGNPRVGGQKINLELGGGQAAIKIKFTIDTASGPRDAFELATKCLQLWKDFIVAKGGVIWQIA